MMEVAFQVASLVSRPANPPPMRSTVKRSTANLLLLAIFALLATCTIGCSHHGGKDAHKNGMNDDTEGKKKAPRKAPAMSAVPAQQLPPDPPPPNWGPTTLLTGATVMTAAGKVHSPGSVLLKEGRIAAVSAGKMSVGDDVRVIDATGRFITPGIIDTHSHVGVYPYPSVRAHQDGNEMSSPTTPQVWAEHSFWPQDPAIALLRGGGVTTIQVLPGSANLIGGRSFIAKLHPKTSARAMRFVGATPGLKMACGENPKRVYGSKGRAPSTRMGNVAGYRAAFDKAVVYKRKWDKYDRDLAFWQSESSSGSSAKSTSDVDKKSKRGDPPTPPAIDIGMETMKGVLEGKVFVHNHCYRADEMNIMLDLAEQYGFTLRSFHHALEAYKIRHRLAKTGTAVSTWADWWGFKMEAFDGIPHNAALVHEAGARAIIHSDSAEDVRRLNQEAAKARTAGASLGIALSDDEILRWITINPAWALGVHDQTGTLEVGKMADVVIWSGHPFSVYSKVDLVFIDGVIEFDRANDRNQTSDFLLGITTKEPALRRHERPSARTIEQKSKGGPL